MAAGDAGDAMGVGEDMTGRLYGIGVGPGDPELMTLKAARILSAAPVVAYPAPNDGESSARAIAAGFIPAGRTEIAIRVPMRVGPVPLDAYGRAADAIAAHLEAGRDVAVLCEGDPFFYGSFMYLHDRLAPRFPVTVVPGVSSLTACAAASNRPLVRRDDVLAVLPAMLPDAELERQLQATDAAAILKVGRHLLRVKAVLARLGRLDASVYVAHATRGDERVVPLAELDDDSAPYFSMILVGQGAGQ
jgi:precorrin-2/cobalt-factor-2 C20-methyltransferase